MYQPQADLRPHPRHGPASPLGPYASAYAGGAAARPSARARAHRRQVAPPLLPSCELALELLPLPAGSELMRLLAALEALPMVQGVAFGGLTGTEQLRVHSSDGAALLRALRRWTDPPVLLADLLAPDHARLTFASHAGVLAPTAEGTPVSAALVAAFEGRERRFRPVGPARAVGPQAPPPIPFPQRPALPLAAGSPWLTAAGPLGGVARGEPLRGEGAGVEAPPAAVSARLALGEAAAVLSAWRTMAAEPLSAAADWTPPALLAPAARAAVDAVPAPSQPSAHAALPLPPSARSRRPGRLALRLAVTGAGIVLAGAALGTAVNRVAARPAAPPTAIPWLLPTPPPTQLWAAVSSAPLAPAEGKNP